ncbi:MAG: hypothetical protein R3C99_01625 [Pirellulaceae bacterium]
MLLTYDFDGVRSATGAGWWAGLALGLMLDVQHRGPSGDARCLLGIFVTLSLYLFARWGFPICPTNRRRALSPQIRGQNSALPSRWSRRADLRGDGIGGVGQRPLGVLFPDGL